MSFYSSSLPNYPYSSQMPLPSAPPMEEESVFFSTGLYPKLPSVSSHVPLYSQPVVQPSLSLPTYKISYWTKESESANQAYLDAWRDLQVVADLPTLTLDDKSIQTLKQIEGGSNQGAVNALLTLMIKVMQAVSKLALGFIVTGSILLLASALLGLPATAILISLFIASPIMAGCALGGIACKIAAYAIEQLKNKWIEHSFQSTIRENKSQLQQVEDLRAWMQMDQLSDIEVRMCDVLAKMQVAQQTSIGMQSQQIIYVQSLLSKIERFYEIEDKLDVQFSMPLLHRFLSLV